MTLAIEIGEVVCSLAARTTLICGLDGIGAFILLYSTLALSRMLHTAYKSVVNRQASTSCRILRSFDTLVFVHVQTGGESFALMTTRTD